MNANFATRNWGSEDTNAPEQQSRKQILLVVLLLLVIEKGPIEDEEEKLTRWTKGFPQA